MKVINIGNDKDSNKVTVYTNVIVADSSGNRNRQKRILFSAE